MKLFKIPFQRLKARGDSILYNANTKCCSRLKQGSFINILCASDHLKIRKKARQNEADLNFCLLEQIFASQNF